ncbi:MAG: hypothetical protein E2P03_03160, partial [Acidobacteria bacterium]
MNESMNSPADTGSGSGTASDTSGFGLSLGRLAEVFHAPVAMFQNMASRWGWTDWVVPILVGVLVSLVISGMVLPHLDQDAPVRDIMEAMGMAPDQIEAQVAQGREFRESSFGQVMQYAQVAVYPL